MLSLIETTASQSAVIQGKDRETAFKQAVIDKITHEMAVLKRLKFAAKSEAYSAEQKNMLDEAIDADMAALERELDALEPPKNDSDKQSPSASRYRGTCPGARSTTSRTPPPEAASSSASARTWPRSWTISRACSRWSATFAANGSAQIARP